MVNPYSLIGVRQSRSSFVRMHYLARRIGCCRWALARLPRWLLRRHDFALVVASLKLLGLLAAKSVLEPSKVV